MILNGTNDEDLEDGEIFDDDDDQTVPLPQPPTQQSQIRPLLKDEPLLQVVSPHPKRRISSPNMMDRKRQQQKNRRGKRNRDDDRLFQQRKKRRNNDEKLVQRDKDVLLEDEDSLLRSGNSPNWENRYEKSDGYILDEEDEEMCGPTRRGGRGIRDFSGRQRRMRNNRGGRRGCGGGGPGNAGGPHRRGGGVGGSGGGDNMCKFFLQGKCHRGTDCTFSHQTHSNRKFELCKFYMNDCCTKKDKCMYMHGDFPCKFHHLGLKCYAGKRCKFSHYPVSNFVKQMLVKHNQTESDKHFLLQLETRSPGRGSPDFLDFHNQEDQEEDYGMDGPNGGPFDQLGGNFFEPQAGRNNRNQNNMNHGQHNRLDDRERKRDRSQAPHNYPKQNRQDEQSGEDDANTTPMPSPSDNANDRDHFSTEKDESTTPAKPSSPLSENKTEDQLSNQPSVEDVPSSLPQKQRELFMRIQQQQHRQNSSMKGGEEQPTNKDDEYKEEDWYSSDDEGNPLSTILKTIKPKSYATEHNNELKGNLPAMPKSLPDIDINEVSKLLETIKQKGAQQEEMNQNKENKMKSNEKPEEKRRVRDPRLQKANHAAATVSEDKASQPVAPGNSTLHPGDVDLRVGIPMTDLAPPSNLDIDLRQLPFKPAPVHQAANEIDASIKSHMIINYVLKPFPQQPKPDYNGVQAKCAGDPRLKMTGVQPQPLKPVSSAPSGIVNPFMMVGQPMYNVDTSHAPPQPAHPPVQSRDPRQRALANDPRRKNLQPQPPPSVIPQHHPPPALRFGQELPIQPQFFHQQRGDSDLRNPSMFNVGDVDLRFQQPPTPRFVFK
ncbi:uncharacterized protein LOC106663841 isoform X3 [Cimex lectularius]|uniref:C3H1-type domain-containing protein n=1 Tax=Cimex lectularius TaxID=79782 RepID=A0A8I6RG05_CIMLE|nr:uncharacterized protein LOC106663841 isoform X3 [Cimex lectularius]